MRMEEAKIRSQRACGRDYHELVLDAPGIAPEVSSGQFVHLRVPRLEQAVLRRPFSVFNATGDTLSVLYKTLGIGTQALARLPPGEKVNLMGPLGCGFPAPEPDKLPVLIAGGYGVAPLHLLASRLRHQRGVLFVGAATADDVLCRAEFEAMGWETRIATEDGSLGSRGYVTAALDEWLPSHARHRGEMYACGPDGMLRAVAARARALNWKAWLSMDKRMGCGVGACLACVQRLRAPDGRAYWGRVCRDGPVFAADDVVWEKE
jgi:dihydroorotate dehydrogenase electron transfer subunit